MTTKHRLMLILIVLFTVISLQALPQQVRKIRERTRGDLTQRISDRTLSRHMDDAAGEARIYAEDHILVKFSPLLTTRNVQAVAKAYGSQASYRIPVVDLYRVQVPEDSSVEEMVEVWRSQRVCVLGKR